MNDLKAKRSGFSVVEFVIVIIVLAAIGFVVMNVANSESGNDADLQEAEQTLEQTNVDDIDTTELDEAVDDLL